MADHDYIMMSNKYKDGKVRLTSAWSDWKIAMEAFRQELSAIDKALKGPTSKVCRGPTHDEFASHLLDVHRMWCDACRCPLPPGGRGVHVRPHSRAAGTSAVVIDPQKRNIRVSTATQTTYGMYGLDMGVLDEVDDDGDNDATLSMTCEGEDLLRDVERYPEKPFNQRGTTPTGVIPSSETTHQAPGLLLEGDTPHELHPDMEGCTNETRPSGSAEANVNKRQRHIMDVDAEALTLNDTTTEGSKYSCSVCGKWFTGNKPSINLTRHLLLHAAERPVHCPICNKAFARKVLLALHMETSTHDAGPLHRASCFICNKTFSLDVLARHMRSHTKEKPYHCEQCGKLFLKKDHLLLHIQIHQRNEPYQCSICNQKFPLQANLNMHHYLKHTLGQGDDKTDPLSIIKVTLE